MTTPNAIRVERDFRGARLILPPRPAGALRAPAAVVAVVGLAVAVWMGLWLAVGFRGGFSGLALLPAIPKAVVLYFALRFSSLAQALRQGRSHCEIVVREGWLRWAEYGGFVRWVGLRRLDSIAKFMRSDAVLTPPGAAAPSIWPSLIAVDRRNRPLPLAFGYPAPVLDELTAHLKAILPDAFPAESGAPAPAFTAETVQPPAPAPLRAEPPPGTRIRMQTLPDGVAFVIPPVGLARGSHGLFPLGVFWTALTAVVGIGFLASGKAAESAGWLIGLFLMIFVAVGIGLLLGGIKMGRRQTMIAATGGDLAVRQSSPFGVKEIRLAAADVEDVRLGPSGMEVNNRPVMELQIRTRDGKTQGWLSECRREENEWIAARLRRALGLGE